MIADQGYPSIERFAHECGLEQSVLSRFLNGRRDIYLSTFLRIAASLNMDLGPHIRASSNWQSARNSTSPTGSPRLRHKITVSASEISKIELKRDSSDGSPLIVELSSPSKKTGKGRA